MDRKIVAIIPARGGSKGLPRKNILDLNGKPLIAWTIEAAIKSKVFDRLIVTTEDSEIKDVALTCGAEVIDRPIVLATDTASSLDVIEHVLKNIESDFSHFILLQPTSPLRDEKYIIEAWNIYNRKSAKSLVSVCEVEHSPFKMLIEEKGNLKPLTAWEDLTKPRQSLPKAYLPNGAIYIAKIDDFLYTKNLFAEPCEFFEMNKIVSIDIDSKEDLLKVENILNGDFE